MRNAGESLSIEIAPLRQHLNNTVLYRAIEAIEAIDAGQAQPCQSGTGFKSRLTNTAPVDVKARLGDTGSNQI